MAFDLEEKFLQAAEQKLGARLPASYRLAMLENNGGEIDTERDLWVLHPVFDQSSRKRIARTCNDIVRETAVMKNWTGWPENAVAIAANGCGDALLFLKEDKYFADEVYEWSHETGLFWQVAADFRELETIP